MWQGQSSPFSGLPGAGRTSAAHSRAALLQLEAEQRGTRPATGKGSLQRYTTSTDTSQQGSPDTSSLTSAKPPASRVLQEGWLEETSTRALACSARPKQLSLPRKTSLQLNRALPMRLLSGRVCTSCAVLRGTWRRTGSNPALFLRRGISTSIQRFETFWVNCLCCRYWRPQASMCPFPRAEMRWAASIC